MKTRLLLFAAIATVAGSTIISSCSKKDPPAPVISITTQPTEPAALTEGAIPADTKLTIVASATEGAVPTYQWYSNTSASNTTGWTAVGGATSASYTIPTTLTAAGGPYYYYCVVSAEGATAKSSNVVTVTVNAAPVPVISITTQPTAPDPFTEGEIPADTELTVVASVTEGAELTYQWYSNTSEDNTGGTALDGETGASYTIPTTLTEGTYYYYCIVSAEGATDVTSNVVTVTVEAVEGVTIAGIEWATRNVAAPGTFAAEPEDLGMLYQWGKKVGWSTTDPLVSSNEDTIWDDTPYDGDEWLSENDPCPKGWRVPTRSEFEALCDANAVNQSWTEQGGVNGRLFTDATTGGSIFLPAVGHRSTTGSVNYQGSSGYYWSSIAYSGGSFGYSLGFSFISSASPFNILGYANGFGVRCVRIDVIPNSN